MAIKIKQIISEDIIKKDKKDINLDRIHQLAGIKKQEVKVKPIFESAEFIKLGPDNNVYAIVKDKAKYWIKKAANSETLTESSFDYLYGLQNQSKANGFTTYGSALKSLNLIFKDLHEQNGVLLEQTLFTEDDRRKFVLKFQAPKQEIQAPAEPEKKKPEPEPVEDFPEPFSDSEDNDEFPNQFPMDSEDKESLPMDDSSKKEDNENSEEPVKEIQKLTGKLGQQLRDNKDVVDEDIVKYVMNSMISAIDLGKLSDSYREELISKLDKDEKASEEKQIDEDFNSKLEELRIADRLNEAIKKSLRKLIKESEQSNQELVQAAFDYITSKYSHDDYIDAFDEEVNSGDWLEDDWEDEFESAYDAYMDTGRGEAEHAVLKQYVDEACEHLGCTEGQLVFDVKPSIYDMLQDEWEIIGL